MDHDDFSRRGRRSDVVYVYVSVRVVRVPNVNVWVVMVVMMGYIVSDVCTMSCMVGLVMLCIGTSL